jgi:hypothetical protein
MTAALLAAPDVEVAPDVEIASEITAAVFDAAMVAPCSPDLAPPESIPAPAGRKRTPRPAVPEWELPELTAQAELHNQRIVESETSVLDDYWLLGRLLESVRGNFRRGTWLPWLNRHGIDHTRAKRARLLAQLFTSAEELRGLSLHQALRIARERKKGERARVESPLIKRFQSGMRALLGIRRGLATEEASPEHAEYARELLTAATAIFRACPAGEATEQEAEGVPQWLELSGSS